MHKEKLMPKSPSYEELKDRIDHLETTVRQLQSVNGEDRGQYFSLLNDIFRKIPSFTAFEKSARMIFERLKELTGGRSGYVAMLSDDGHENEVLFLDAGGFPCDVDPALPMPIRGLREIAYKTGKVAYDNHFMNSRWMKFMPEGHVRLDNVLFSPMEVDGKIIGVIGIANKPGGFTEKDLVIAEDFGKLTSIAFLYADSQRKIISEHKALSESQAFLNSIFRVAPAGIGVVKDRHIIEVNQTFCSMVGYAKEEMMGKTSDMVYPSQKEFQRVGRVKYEQIQRTGSGTIETQLRRKDGSIIDVILSSTLVDPSDQSKGVTFTALDITERKKTEKELKESRQALVTVLDSIDAHIYAADMDTYEILFMNKKMIKTFGRDFTGQPCWKVLRNQAGPCPFCRLDKLTDAKGRPSGFHTWHDINPITGRWYLNNDRAVQWIDGRTVKLQVATDITDIKTMEEKLREIQKMESIGNLAGGIAHDFNNILFPIIGLSELLMEDLPDNSQQHANAREIYRAGKRGSELVSQILAFGRQSMKLKIPVSLHLIAKEAVQLSRATIPASIKISQSLDKKCRVMADSSQIHQVIMNLMTNAYHAVDISGGKISITLEKKDTRQEGALDKNLRMKNCIRLTISDNGHGISRDIIEKIFDPYFTTKKNGKGTGLGLAVAYGIIKEHQGDIKVVSTPHNGTSFFVYLPPVAEKSSRSSRKQEEGITGGDEHILLIDDEEAIANVEKAMLERMGYRVSGFTSSPKALKAFKQAPDAYDIVISDMNMPEMTGVELSGEILLKRPDIPFVICTGFSELIDKEKAEALGITAIIDKPATKETILKTIRRVLDEKKSGRQT